MTEELLEEWVTTKEASTVRKVGFSQRYIAGLASKHEIVAERVGKKKWLVKVIYENKRWNLVRTDEIEKVRMKETDNGTDKLEGDIQELRKVDGGIDILREYKLILTTGIQEFDVPLPIRPIFQKLSLLGIVEVKQRQRFSGPRQFDLSYWEVTDHGRELIRYLGL